MAEIYLPQRQQLPNTVGGVKAPYELADQSGVKSFGKDVEKVAAYSLDKIIDMRAGNEYSDWENTARAEEESLRSFVNQNPYATRQQLEAQRDKMLKNIETASTKMTTNRARDWAKRSIYSQQNALKAKATGVIEEVVIRQETQKLRLNIDNAVAKGDYDGLKRIYGDAAESGLLPTGDLEDENGLAGTMFKRDAMQLQANVFKAQKETGYANAYSVMDNGGTMEDAQAEIKKTVAPSDWNIAFNDLKSYEDTVKARQKVQKEEAVSQLKEANYPLETSGNPDEVMKAIDNVRNNNTLTVDEKRKEEDYLQGIIKNLASEKEDKTDDIVRYGLKNMSLDIWRGTATKKQFDEQLNAARVGVTENGKRVYRFGDIASDSPLLTDQDYASLGDSAATELRKSQADDISRYTRDTANVILGPVASNLFTTDEQGNFVLNPNALGGGDKEQAKYLLNFVNQYEEELRGWIAKNPDKSGKEFYTFAQEKKYEYWNTSIDQIKAKSGKDGKPANGLPTISTEEDYKKLASGTEYIAPNGKRMRKK